MTNEELEKLIKKSFLIGQQLHEANPFEYEKPINEEQISIELLKDFIQDNESILNDESAIEQINLRRVTSKRLKILMSNTGLDADTIIRVALTHGLNSLDKRFKINKGVDN